MPSGGFMMGLLMKRHNGHRFVLETTKESNEIQQQPAKCDQIHSKSIQFKSVLASVPHKSLRNPTKIRWKKKPEETKKLTDHSFAIPNQSIESAFIDDRLGLIRWKKQWNYPAPVRGSSFCAILWEKTFFEIETNSIQNNRNHRGTRLPSRPWPTGVYFRFGFFFGVCSFVAVVVVVVVVVVWRRGPNEARD